MDPDDFYIEEERAAQAAEDREQRRVRLLAHARLVTILAAIWSLYEATQSVDAKGRWLIAAAALTGTAFVILIVIHARARQRMDNATARRRACD